MARHNKKKIVVLNHKAEIIGYYDSIRDCERLNDYPIGSIQSAVSFSRIYRCMRFIYESEARNRWEKGTLSELRFKTLKERNEEKRKRFIEVKQSPTWKNAMRNLGDRLKIEYANGGRESIRKAAEAHRRPVRCLDTGKLYSSITEAGLDIGVDKSMICKAVKNNYRVKGLKFEYC